MDNAIADADRQDKEELEEVEEQIKSGVIALADRPPPPKRGKYVRWCRDNDPEALRGLIVRFLLATGGARGRGRGATGYFDFARYFEEYYRKTETVHGSKKLFMTNDQYVRHMKKHFPKLTWDQIQVEWSKELSAEKAVTDSKFGETRVAIDVEDFIIEQRIAGSMKVHRRVWSRHGNLALQSLGGPAQL